MLRFIAVVVCALLGAAAPASAASPAFMPALPAERPNIVVIYMDDVSPHDGRLWSDSGLTPTLHERFIASGVHFQNAIGETPLCCPGRAGLLTGLHTHNHRVVRNKATMFRPQMHIGKALKRSGYATMFIGKYFNRNDLLTEADWVEHGKGWTHLDAIKGPNGEFYEYRVQTKTGIVRYESTHSTEMVAERALMRFRSTPATAPIFAVLSVYNLHKPNTPLARFSDDARCEGMPPYKPPSYNEEDVSDKPLWVQDQPLLPEEYADGWPMAGYCREMLGVDWLAKTVVDELQALGRLSNTLLVFTADNGTHWGIHRIGQKKLTPYSTPVPLYLSWPAAWGTAHYEVTDAVSNIDLAPTFCALGGCTLGPYPTGQARPDGKSLVRILRDPAGPGIEREDVLESSFSGRRIWHGLRTSPDSDIGFWHYVEWQDGSVELYDLVADPFELQNKSSDPGYAEVRAQLATRLAALWAEGR